MRRIFWIAALLVVLVSAARAQTIAGLVQYVGRIYGIPNYGIFQDEYRRGLTIWHNEGLAAQYAQDMMNLDEENRLCDALEQIRAVSPNDFDRIFHQHGLDLRSIRAGQ